MNPLLLEVETWMEIYCEHPFQIKMARGTTDAQLTNLVILFKLKRILLSREATNDSLPSSAHGLRPLISVILSVMSKKISGQSGLLLFEFDDTKKRERRSLMIDVEFKRSSHSESSWDDFFEIKECEQLVIDPEISESTKIGDDASEQQSRDELSKGLPRPVFFFAEMGQ